MNQVKLSHIALAVLGLVAEKDESYPYELLKKIEDLW